MRRLAYLSQSSMAAMIAGSTASFRYQGKPNDAPMFVKALISAVRPGDLLECWVRTRQG